MKHGQNLGWSPNDEKSKKQMNKLIYNLGQHLNDGKPMEQTNKLQQNIGWCLTDEKLKEKRTSLDRTQNGISMIKNQKNRE